MSDAVRLWLFQTPVGTCGIAWNDVGVCAVSLPGPTADATRERLVRHHPSARETQPGRNIQSAIDDINRLLAGERVDLSHIVLDESAQPDFNRRVYAIARAIPPGQTMTYGAIAKQLGDPLLAQRVGQALGRNPNPIITPCHRVLAANGKMGGFSAPGGAETKHRMLLIERALPDEPLDLFQ